MSYDEIIEAITKYFGDTSRSQSETKSDLLGIAEHCETMAESLEG